MNAEPSISPSMSPTPTGPPVILLDTLLLLFLRLIYFLLSRRYLLSTLNPTLRDLSKPETLLPPIASLQAENGQRPHTSSHLQSILPLSDNELDTEDENLLSRTSPNSSYPPSPLKPSSSLPTSAQTSRDAYTRRNIDESPFHTGGGSFSLPTIPEGGNGNIELQALGQKLKDVGAGMGRKVQVLQLSHGRRGDAIGAKAIKKATRGLSWLARSVSHPSPNLVSCLMSFRSDYFSPCASLSLAISSPSSYSMPSVSSILDRYTSTFRSPCMFCSP